MAGEFSAGRYSGGRRRIYVGTVGDPSAPASSSATIPRSLKGALDPDCDDYLFDCPGKEMEAEEEEEEKLKMSKTNESLIRTFIKEVLTFEGVSLKLNPTGHAPMYSIPQGLPPKTESELEEDELEEEEVDEINAIGMGGGAGVSRGTVRGVTLPLGMSPPSHGRKRRTPAAAAGSGFGGAKPFMPGKRKSKSKKK
jgi:hypothetical protein